MSQPLLSWPTRFSLGTFTSSKNTSQNSSCISRLTIGRTVMPGEVMSTSRKLMPSCFFAALSVRASRKTQFASCASVVQIFWPLTRQWSPMSTASVRSEARSEPLPGSL